MGDTSFGGWLFYAVIFTVIIFSATSGWSVFRRKERMKSMEDVERIEFLEEDIKCKRNEIRNIKNKYK